MPEYPRKLQRVALYLRKSRADVEAETRGEGETLSRHRSALLALANQNEYEIRDTYEEIVSGERILDRPEMQKLLHAVETGTYTAVLCMDLDRLGRGNMVDQGLIQETFKASNTLIITPRKVYNLQDELDEEWSEFEAFLARRELKIITRRLQRGRRQSASLGKSISRRPPYGYLRDASLKLHPNPQTAPVVQMIFRLSAAGWGLTKISKHLTSLGISTPAGKPVWDRSSVYAILKNPVYQGEIVWGRVRYQKKKDGTLQYQRIKQAKENWIVVKDAHDALVDVETYLRYKQGLERRPRIPVQKQLVNPFAALLYCGECGKSLRRQQTYNRPTNRLLCVTPGCTTKSASFELVEQRILEELRTVFGGLAIHVELSNRFSEVSDSELRGFLQQRLQELAKQRQTLEEQKSTLHELLEKRVYDIRTFYERSQVIHQRLQEVSHTFSRLEHELADIEEKGQAEKEFTPRLINVLDSYKLTEDVSLKNKLLKNLIEKIIYRRKPTATKTDEFELEIFLRL